MPPASSRIARMLIIVVCVVAVATGCATLPPSSSTVASGAIADFEATPCVLRTLEPPERRG